MPPSRSVPTRPRATRAPAGREARHTLLVVAAICVGLGVAGGLGGWWLGWFGRAEDPRVVEIGTMMRGLLERERQRQGPANFLTALDRMSGIVALGLKVNALPEPLRPRIMPLAWGVMMDHLDDRMDAYFALRSSAERSKFIDGELAQMDFMRKAFESRGGDGGRGGDRAAGGGDRGGGRGTARAPGGPGGGPGGGGEQRWTKWVLDRSTPEQRARITEYMAAFERRLAETGRKL
jgi:hypothetical protein